MKRAKSGRIKDVFSQSWDVSEHGGTRHGFDIGLGFPAYQKRGMGGVGRSRIVLTQDLTRHLERFRMQPSKADLPISLSALRRLREMLGHHIRNDIRSWWEKRRKDLAELSGTEFARKHGKSPQAAHYTHRILIGKQHRPKFSWTVPEVLAVLDSGKPDVKVAAVLGISPNSLRRLRSKCRRLGLGGEGSFARRRRPRDWWKAAEVQAVLRSGKRYAEIAAALGVGMGALSRIITQSRRAGLGPPRRYKKRSPPNWWKSPRVQAALFSGKHFPRDRRYLGPQTV